MKLSLKRTMTATAASTAALLPVLALAACGSHPAAVSLPKAGAMPARPAATASHHREHAVTTQAETTATTTSPCVRSQLVAWIAVPRTGFTNESNIYNLEISNISGHTCTLYGYPGVSALRRSGQQLGSAAGRAGGIKDLATLARGGTAHAIIYIAYKGDFTASSCKPATAAVMRVYAPGDFGALEFPFSFPACSRRGPVYLSVSPVAPGVGIPGYNP